MSNTNQNSPAASIPVWMGYPDFASSANAGLVNGAKVAFTIGHVTGIGTGTGAVDVCEQGSIYPFLSSAVTLKVSSASANDAAAGTGARTVQIQGLDASFNPLVETITLNGTTAVNTVNQYYRINGFAVTSAGSGGVNAGDITLQIVAGGSIQGIIRAGIGNSQQAVYTVPAGYIGILDSAQFSMSGPPATNYGQIALTANLFSTTRSIGARCDINSGFPYTENVLGGYVNPPGTDITVRLLSVGQAATEVSASFSVILLNRAIYGI